MGKDDVKLGACGLPETYNLLFGKCRKFMSGFAIWITRGFSYRKLEVCVVFFILILVGVEKYW